MASENKPITGAALARRSARACDNCIKKRARWYCATDDPFLCQSCDSSLQSSANRFSPPHRRLHLRSTTLRNISVPFFPQGFTCRKPRTPRTKMKKNREKFKFVSEIMNGDSLQLVPEVDQFSGDESEKEEDQQQDVHRVPVFNPTLNDAVSADISKTQTFVNQDNELSGDDIDVDRLLNDEEGIGMEELGIPNLNDCNKNEEELGNRSRKTFLRLDYDGILSAWGGRQSPWITGRRNRAGVDFLGAIGKMAEEGGREARVWRYREKRQRRLFAKKIRYEVRKVNAEKRPRIKGRFVKRIQQAN